MRAKQPRPPKTLGELIAQRRQELGLRQVELARRLKGRHGGPVSQERIHDIEIERMGPVRLPILEQLPRALNLERDVVYFWGGYIPPNIRPSGLSESTAKQAWTALRKVITRARTKGKPVKNIKKPPARGRHKEGEPGLRGWQGRHTLGGLIGWRRRKLGLTQSAFCARVKGQHGEPLSVQRLGDIEQDRFGVPRQPLLRQLARALQLDIDVLYLWAGRLPPDLRPAGLDEQTIEKAWSSFRTVIARARGRGVDKRP